MQRHIAAMHCCMPRQKRRRISFYATYDIAHSVFSMLLYSYDCYTHYIAWQSQKTTQEEEEEAEFLFAVYSGVAYM